MEMLLNGKEYRSVLLGYIRFGELAYLHDICMNTNVADSIFEAVSLVNNDSYFTMRNTIPESAMGEIRSYLRRAITIRAKALGLPIKDRLCQYLIGRSSKIFFLMDAPVSFEHTEIITRPYKQGTITLCYANITDKHLLPKRI